MDFIVIGLGPELRTHLFWSESYATFREPRALFREAVARSFSPNLSAIAVASCVVACGYSVQLIDLGLEYGIPFADAEHEKRYRALANDLAESSPRAVLISCPSAREHLALLEVARTVKEWDSSCPVVVGGYHATSYFSRIISSGFVDVVVRGDLEPISGQLLRAIHSRSYDMLLKVRNLVLRTGEDVSMNPWATFSPADSRSVFDYSLVQKYLPLFDVLSTVSSKGCAYNCNFCQEHVMRRGYVLRSPEEVLDEVVDILSLYEATVGPRRVGFYFMDAFFGASKDWLDRFCRTIVSRRLHFRWAFQTRPGLLEPQDYEAISAAGCYLVHLGLESFSPTMLRRMGKTKEPAEYLLRFQDDLRTATQCDLSVEYNILFGAPGETRETLSETRRGIERTKESYPEATLNLNLFRLFPDTKSHDEVGKKYGSRILVPRWWEKGVIPEITLTVLPSAEISTDELLRFYEDLYSDDNCYRRRGTHPGFWEYVTKGILTKRDMVMISHRNRYAFSATKLQREEQMSYEDSRAEVPLGPKSNEAS